MKRRVTIPLLFIAALLGGALVQPACLGNDPASTDVDMHMSLDLATDAAMSSPDLARFDGGEDLSAADLSKPVLDFAYADLAGLVNCYGRAVCDPTMQFCITYNDGSAATPGKSVFGSPACYAPDVDCADNGQNMDCGCIQNDDTLGVGCEGSCVDNGDGTFVCYAN